MLYTCIVDAYVFASQSNEFKLSVLVTSILDARHDGVTCFHASPRCAALRYLSKSFVCNSFASITYACVSLCAGPLTLQLTLVVGQL